MFSDLLCEGRRGIFHGPSGGQCMNKLLMVKISILKKLSLLTAMGLGICGVMRPAKYLLCNPGG